MPQHHPQSFHFDHEKSAGRQYFLLSNPAALLLVAYSRCIEPWTHSQFKYRSWTSSRWTMGRRRVRDERTERISMRCNSSSEFCEFSEGQRNSGFPSTHHQWIPLFLFRFIACSSSSRSSFWFSLRASDRVISLHNVCRCYAEILSPCSTSTEIPVDKNTFLLCSTPSSCGDFSPPFVVVFWKFPSVPLIAQDVNCQKTLFSKKCCNIWSASGIP